MKVMIAAAALLMMLYASAESASATEINFSAVMLDQNNVPFTDCKKWDTAKSPPTCDQLVDLTLGGIAMMALNVAEQGASPSDVTSRGQLVLKLSHGGKIDVSADEIKLIKDQMLKRAIAPVAVVRAIEMLDPASLKK